MFVGHAALAFAVVGLLADAAGRPRREALALAGAAALFATVPDVDVLYAVTGLLQGSLFRPVALATSFWAASTAVHRTITHSLVLAVPAATAFALMGRDRVGTAGGVAIAGAVVAIATAVSGVLGGVVATGFVVAGGVVGLLASREGLSARAVGAVALFGLVSHPFGDLFTGRPPALLYPFDVHLLAGRVVLSSDPTLHLLVAFGVEVAAIWAGVLVFARLTDRSLVERTRPRAVAGVAYAVAVLVVPPPTLDLSYPFVFSVLGMGLVGAVPLDRRLPDATTAAITGLAGVTLAAAAYAVAYLLLGAVPLPGEGF